jgi:GT2 family glycosyltransferase
VIVSVEIPAFKGEWLQRCIDSVLYQSSPNWRLSLLWDGGDDSSRRLLEKLQKRNHPKVTVHFGPNRGIAKSRRFLSEHSQGDYILPVDDDDVLPFHAVERLLSVAEQKPWAALIRGQRRFIDQEGRLLDTRPWFPFEPRHYQHGMVTDLWNHCQPYLIRRSAYDRTTGWEGFDDMRQAGEDCDVYLKLEELGSIELVDEVLYYYRVSPRQASVALTKAAGFEMWRRLADKTIERIGLPLRRVSENPPFVYERQRSTPSTLEAIDFVFLADGDSVGEADAGSLRATLVRLGFPGDAVHVVSERNVTALNEALLRTRRPLVCIIDDTIQGASAEQLEVLVSSFDEHDLDLAAPIVRRADGSSVAPDASFTYRIRASLASRTGSETADGAAQTTREPWLHDHFMLLRREVVKAVGGLDEGFRELAVATVDFCLKAVERDFRLAYLSTDGYTAPGWPTIEAMAPDLSRLHAKWGARPEIWDRERVELPEPEPAKK